MMSIDDLQKVVYELFKEPIIGPLKPNMAEIIHLENRHDVIFFCWGWSDLDKISQTGAEWHVDCGDVVEIETRYRIPIWRTFGRIQRNVIPEPPATLHGAAIRQIQCHDPKATWHTAGCFHQANSITCHPRAPYHIAGCCHLMNSLSWFQSHMPHCRVEEFHPPYWKSFFAIFYFFKCSLGFYERRLLYRLRYTCWTDARDRRRSTGRLFRARGPATARARSPMVDNGRRQSYPFRYTHTP